MKISVSLGWHPLKAVQFLCALMMIFISTPLIAQEESLREQIFRLPLSKKSPLAQNKMPIPPKTPNPYLSLLPPNEKPDYETWTEYERLRASFLSKNGPQSIQSFSRTSAGPQIVEEIEGNDSQRRAQRLKRFGIKGKQRDHLIIEGQMGSEELQPTLVEGESTEDNGSILLATETSIVEPFTGLTYEGEIGDGPTGLSDFDFFQISGRAGELFVIDITTPDPFGDLDPFVAVFDELGTLLDFNDDGTAESFDSFLSFEIPADGNYYFSVGGLGAFIPANPFDSRSGSVTGQIGSEGSYEAKISKIEFSDDVDYYSFNLRKGDIVAGGLKAQNLLGSLTIEAPRDQLLVSTSNNTSGYPEESPLNLEGNASIYHIAEENGFFTIAVADGLGAYELELRVTRSNFEENGGTQILFIDYDGGEFDLNAFNGNTTSPDIRILSPFRDFLPALDLPDDPLSILKMTNQITRVVKENIQKDLKRARINPRFNVIIVGNSGLGGLNNPSAVQRSEETIMDFQGMKISKTGLDDETLAFLEQHADDQTAFPVSKVFVGGTVEESGISTIGIAQSIDPGNFGTEETALVLLDIVTDTSATQAFSFNNIPLAPNTSKEELVVTGLGNITAHELGHFLGNWHNDGFDDVQTIMDEGPGGPFNLYGVGPSGIFGASDTQDVDFGTSSYSRRESFRGIENTANQTAWGLTSNIWPLFIRTIFDPMADVKLSQTYPNPARSRDDLTISFSLPRGGAASLQVHDFSGQPIATLFAGQAKADQEYQVKFKPEKYNLKPGIYVYTLKTSKGSLSKRIFLVQE